ncbi:uncharacterized protein LOC126374335 [Pectinophora gossypiella]|uniref:uncharacterized protein LOC126374335 n=1 Tax=Pectinophora gossypiella TaxID=13191 RepID=UPI00214F03BE|nr:uncharacterized protein LOC126374335 [Pectinophora gossypiella]
MKEYGYKLKDGVIYGGDVSLPSHLNYGKIVVELLRRHKDKQALIDGITGEKITFNELAQKVLNTAASLIQLGVKRRDVVSICSENRIEFMITVFATIYIGAVANFVNCAYSKDEIIHTIQISKPKHIFLSPTTYDKYFKILNKNVSINQYFVFGKPMKDVNVICFEELVRNSVKGDSVQAANITDGSETAIIVYSSGTTGLPKGAKWTHLNLLVTALQPICTYRNLTFLNIAPWTNTVGYMLTTQMLLDGKSAVFLTRFDEVTYLRTIEKYKVGFLLAVPPLVILLSKCQFLYKYDVSSIKVILCGGASLESDVIADVKRRLPNLEYVLQAYGMSEATGAITMEYESANKLGSVGKVMPGIIVKVVDTESRKILPPNQPGEVCLKGAALFGGYIGHNVTGSDDYDEEGFFKTGDIAYYDDEGFFFIVDRIKDLIKYKSWQVGPSELEAVLLQHPEVKDAAVIGVPDSLAGELPLAFIIKQPGSNVNEKEIINFVEPKVSPWKRLRGGVRFVSEIPKNGSGKILRRQLRELIAKSKSKL